MLNKNKLNIILSVQRYKKFIIANARMLNEKIDWYEMVKKYYFSIPSELLEKEGLKQNINDLERILIYKITDEILNCLEDELSKFNF